MSPSTKTLKSVLAKTLKLFEPIPRITFAEWADKYRVIAEGTSAEPGPYRSDRIPYQKAIMDRMQFYSDVIMLIFSQGGKSEILQNALGYYIHIEPCNILVKYPTLDSAKEFSGKKLTQMIEGTPVLRKLIRSRRTRDSGNKILSKTFSGGSLTMVGANSPSALRAKSCRVVMQDEVDSDENGAEGDPVALADMRATNFHDKFLLKCTTVTEKGHSRGEKLYSESTQDEWNVDCPHCKQSQVLKWGQVKFDSEKPDNERDAHIECSHCRGRITDEDRIGMVMRGRLVSLKPNSLRFGVHINGLNKVMGLDSKKFRNYLEQFVSEFLEAKRGGQATLRVWINTFLCETFEEEAEVIKHDEVQARAYTFRHDIPAEVAMTTTEIDVQRNRLEAQITGWGANDHSYAIEYKVFLGDPNMPAVWNELNEWLRTPRLHASGEYMLPSVTVVDTGTMNTLAYEFVRKNASLRYYAIKGASTGSSAPLVSRPQKSGVKKVKLFMIGTHASKSMVYSRLRVTDLAENGYCHFPIGRGFDGDYFKQLTAETVTTKYQYGKRVQVWDAHGRRNEALDLKGYSIAAYYIATSYHNISIKKELARLKGKTGEKDEEEETETTVPPTPNAPQLPVPAEPTLPAPELMRTELAPPPKAQLPAPKKRRSFKFAGF